MQMTHTHKNIPSFRASFQCPPISLNFPSSLSLGFNLNHQFEGKTSSFKVIFHLQFHKTKVQDSMFVAIYFENVLQFCGICQKIFPSKFNIRSNRGQNPIF